MSGLHLPGTQRALPAAAHDSVNPDDVESSAKVPVNSVTQSAIHLSPSQKVPLFDGAPAPNHILSPTTTNTTNAAQNTVNNPNKNSSTSAIMGRRKSSSNDPQKNRFEHTDAPRSNSHSNQSRGDDEYRSLGYHPAQNTFMSSDYRPHPTQFRGVPVDYEHNGYKPMENSGVGPGSQTPSGWLHHTQIPRSTKHPKPDYQGLEQSSYLHARPSDLPVPLALPEQLVQQQQAQQTRLPDANGTWKDSSPSLDPGQFYPALRYPNDCTADESQKFWTNAAAGSDLHSQYPGYFSHDSFQNHVVTTTNYGLSEDGINCRDRQVAGEQSNVLPAMGPPQLPVVPPGQSSFTAYAKQSNEKQSEDKQSQRLSESQQPTAGKSQHSTIVQPHQTINFHPQLSITVQPPQPVQKQQRPGSSRLQFRNVADARAHFVNRVLEPREDGGLPQTQADREFIVGDLLDCVQDMTEAKDTVTNKQFRGRWLGIREGESQQVPPLFASDIHWSVATKEKMCWEILDLAERIYREGWIPDSPVSKSTITESKKEHVHTFRQRIDLIKKLLREAKSRVGSMLDGSEALLKSVLHPAYHLKETVANRGHNGERGRKIKRDDDLRKKENNSVKETGGDATATFPVPDLSESIMMDFQVGDATSHGSSHPSLSPGWEGVDFPEQPFEVEVLYDPHTTPQPLQFLHDPNGLLSYPSPLGSGSFNPSHQSLKRALNEYIEDSNDENLSPASPNKRVKGTPGRGIAPKNHCNTDKGGKRGARHGSTSPAKEPGASARKAPASSD